MMGVAGGGGLKTSQLWKKPPKSVVVGIKSSV